MPDLTILQRIAGGERDAFAELVQRYQQALFGFLGRVGLTQAQAEDIAQETFLKAWSHLQQYDPARGQFNTWLFTIARNLAISAMQSRPPDAELTDESLAALACDRPNPMQQLQAKQQMERLQRALRRLPVADRSALALAYVHGLSLADAARIEGIGLAAIKTRLHRARLALRNLLESEHDRRSLP